MRATLPASIVDPATSAASGSSASPGPAPEVIAHERPVSDVDQASVDLGAALRERQPWAAQRLWDQHASRVRRLLSRMLGPREDVDDILQEVFLRVFSRVHTLRSAASLREFVTSVAIHVVKWELRRRWVRRKVRLSATGLVPEVVVDGVDPEARDALGRCYVILDKLGARERAAFVLRYMEEMKMEEVASALEVSLSTAKRLVNRSAVLVSKHVGNDQDLRDYFTRGGSDGSRRR
jgi:RNA polymerase sigma-70 factor (ECF subfamily)